MTRPSNVVRLRSLSDLDSRTRAARNAFASFDRLIEALGGEAFATETERMLAARAAVLSALCEDLEARHLGGEQIDVGAYGSLVGQLRRCLAAVGLTSGEVSA